VNHICVYHVGVPFVRVYYTFQFVSTIPYVLVLPPTFHYHTHSYLTSLVHVSSNVKNICINISCVTIYQSPSIGVDGLNVIHIQLSSICANINLDFGNPIMYYVSWFLHKWVYYYKIMHLSS
jgi:hypothetical protein